MEQTLLHHHFTAGVTQVEPGTSSAVEGTSTDMLTEAIAAKQNKDVDIDVAEDEKSVEDARERVSLFAPFWLPEERDPPFLRHNY